MGLANLGFAQSGSRGGNLIFMVQGDIANPRIIGVDCGEQALLKKPALIKSALKSGETRAEKIAEKKLLAVKKRIGLVG